MIVTLLAPACGRSQGLRDGNSLASNGGLYSILRGVPVGEEWATMNATLHNTSPSPLTLRRVSVTGPGVGSVIKFILMRVGPLVPVTDPSTYTSGGVFRTYPPAQERQGKCSVQKLVPVDGYVLQPDAAARVLLLTQAASPGSFMFRGVTVEYEQSGQTMTELVDFGQRGSVVNEGRVKPRLTAGDLRCATPHGVLPPTGS
jgi:hypothetical protein